MARKAFIIVGVLVVIGVAIGIIVAVSGGGKKDDANTKGGGSGNKDASKAASNATKSDGDGNAKVKPGTAVDESQLIGKNGSGSGSAGAKEPSSDPEKATPAVTMLAIGDWGATNDKPGSCCNKYRKTTKDSLEEKTDYWAQINVAEILGQSAAEIKPARVIGHGDNLYWNGAGTKDILTRMENTFEAIYTHPSLISVPWINVVGNHDLGGSDFICGEVDYQFKECGSVAELETALEAKFTNQATYKSPNNDRWKMKDHYYVESVEKDGVSVDIFNMDTNYADSHGMRQICCQCYGYIKAAFPTEEEQKVEGKRCKDAKSGDKICANGNVEMYNACAAKITKWSEDAMVKLQEGLKESKATWKIINSHYSPHFHMSEDKMKQWFKITKDGGVHLWLNGHTHGFNHDITPWGTHFYENGAGGGIQSETSGHPPEVAEKYVTHQWIAPGNPYGFLELYFSKDWLTTKFVTFDDKWVFSKEKEQIGKGGFRRGHCWHIPQTVGKGRECKK